MVRGQSKGDHMCQRVQIALSNRQCSGDDRLVCLLVEVIPQAIVSIDMTWAAPSEVGAKHQPRRPNQNQREYYRFQNAHARPPLHDRTMIVCRV
jgi:hypothetical protein